jgi:hypothetical protein
MNNLQQCVGKVSEERGGEGGRKEGRGGCLRRLRISRSGGTEGGQMKQEGSQGRFSKKLLDHFQIK